MNQIKNGGRPPRLTSREMQRDPKMIDVRLTPKLGLRLRRIVRVPGASAICAGCLKLPETFAFAL